MGPPTGTGLPDRPWAVPPSASVPPEKLMDRTGKRATLGCTLDAERDISCSFVDVMSYTARLREAGAELLTTPKKHFREQTFLGFRVLGVGSGVVMQPARQVLLELAEDGVKAPRQVQSCLREGAVLRAFLFASPSPKNEDNSANLLDSAIMQNP